MNNENTTSAATIQISWADVRSITLLICMVIALLISEIGRGSSGLEATGQLVPSATLEEPLIIVSSSEFRGR